MRDYSEFRRFHNGLRILMNIDFADFPGPHADWPIFLDHPWRYFISCPDPIARALWAVIQRRQCAWDSAEDAAWNAAWDAAWGGGDA
jgi:hypothetical protein